MESSPSQPVASKPRRKFRVGLRGLIAIVSLAALALGWFAWQDRLAHDQTAWLGELRRMGVVVNDPHPTPFCFLAMRLLWSDSQKVESKLIRYLDPGWFSRPRGFNAGMLPDDQVAAVVAKIGHFGPVKEVRFDRPPLAGLRLFYIDRIPYERLGVSKASCTFTDHPAPSNR